MNFARERSVIQAHNSRRSEGTLAFRRTSVSITSFNRHTCIINIDNRGKSRAAVAAYESAFTAIFPLYVPAATRRDTRRRARAFTSNLINP